MLRITATAVCLALSAPLAMAETTAQKLVAAAKARIGQTTIYDPSYVRLAYPKGDVPNERGVCSDVIVRAYRALGIDLQKRIHEDMRANFSKYPKRWGLKRVDRNIDHRRVPNLRTFFKRHGQSLPVSKDPASYKPGDMVTWDLKGDKCCVFGRLPHIGIVANKRTRDGKRPLIIHNIGQGTVHEDILFRFTITGHYRYFPEN